MLKRALHSAGRVFLFFKSITASVEVILLFVCLFVCSQSSILGFPKGFNIIWGGQSLRKIGPRGATLGVYHQNKCISSTSTVTVPISTMFYGSSKGDRSGNQIRTITLTEFKQGCPFLDTLYEAFIHYKENTSCVRDNEFWYYWKNSHKVKDTWWSSCLKTKPAVRKNNKLSECVFKHIHVIYI